MLHYGEEAQLVPSHQIYFAGCNLRCGFCTVAEWNDTPLVADAMDRQGLAEMIERRRREGAKTLNLLGGEPAVSLYEILKLLGTIDCRTVVVWNSNMYYNDIVDRAIRGLAAVFLADLKCCDSRCSEAILGAKDYPEVAKHNIAAACKHAEVIVRVPVLPGHSDCCLQPAFDWLADEIPDVKVSLRADYIPPIGISRAPMDYLSDVEFRMATEAAHRRDLNLIR